MGKGEDDRARATEMERNRELKIHMYTRDRKAQTNEEVQKDRDTERVKGREREFPGCPVVRTQCFHCWGPRFNPWSGN